MLNQSLLLQLGQHCEGLLDRCVGWRRGATYSQIDDRQHVKTEIAQIVLNGLFQVLGRGVHNPRTLVSAAGANLCDDRQVLPIRVQRLLDDLVRYVWSIEIACVDVIDTALDGLTKDRQRSIDIFRGPKT